MLPNRPIGGGEVLDYVGKSGNGSNGLLDEQLIKLFWLLPYVKLLIYVLLIILMIVMILKLFRVRSVFKGRGIKSELDYIDSIKKKDAKILRANKVLNFLVKLFDLPMLSIFRVNKSQEEYWEYNIKRVGIKVPGQNRNMYPKELNAVVKGIMLITIFVWLFVAIFLSSFLGWSMILVTIFTFNFIPNAIIRSIVSEKDLEIKSNFASFYLMIHYVLLTSLKTPLSGIMKSYTKTTNSEEMKRFVDVCIHYMDTYGEYEGTRYIAKAYREIPEVGRLMRLIRQANEGGSVEQELNGFRNDLINDLKYVLNRLMDKRIAKARMSFYLIMPILIQAILSAMSIYMKDLGMVSMFAG